MCIYFNVNKTGLQPVSRSVERILEFFPKGLKNVIIIKEFKNGAKSKPHKT